MANLAWLRIPQEMRVRKQWAVCTLAPLPNGKVNKVPLNPLTGKAVDSTNPSTWATFEQAANSGYPGVGYMLHEDDPFTIIDLDDEKVASQQDLDRQIKVYNAFESYTERSIRQKGVHIIIEGKVGGGMNRDGIEVYDRQRFMICTGNVVRDLPVTNGKQAVLDQLVKEMGGLTPVYDPSESEDERYTDVDILNKLNGAKNAAKFKDLYYRPTGSSEDWSQRDASLAQMIAFYTRNHEQALRLFRGSALYRPTGKGKSPAHYEAYYLLDRTFGRAWEAEKRKDADVETGAKLAQTIIQQHAQKTTAPLGLPTDGIPLPPGLVGEIAKFIYNASPRPVKEVALAGALNFCSGIFGRQYNISRTGLNLNIVLVAETGRGKEAAASGIDALVSAIRPSSPSIDNFVGPAHIASGQALSKTMSERPSMFSFISEFGHLLKILVDPRASASDIRTRQVLLDLFSKSGQHQSMQGSIYSDKEKNTKAVIAPCFAFMGDTTPDLYYSMFSSALIGEGLLPRFLTITYDGPRVDANKNRIYTPSKDLEDHLTSALQSVMNMVYANKFMDLNINPEAQVLLDLFDKDIDTKINAADDKRLVELWNRAHLKVLRVAGLLAVGRNHFDPVVIADDVRWAQNLVTSEMKQLFDRFDAGTIGTDEVKQLPAITEAVIAYLRMPPERRKNSYGVPQQIAATDFIPYGFFRRRFKNHAEFTNQRMGLTYAVKAALKDACELGILVELSQEQNMALGLMRSDNQTFCVGPNFKSGGN